MSTNTQNSITSVSTSATAQAAIVSAIISYPSVSATAPAATTTPYSSASTSVSATAPATAVLDAVSSADINNSMPVEHANVSILKSCVKKANNVSLPKKSVDWALIHQYMIFELEPEERKDTDKYELDAGEISWKEWRAQKQWNIENQDTIDAEERMIMFKMDQDAEWDPDFDLVFDVQREEAEELVLEEECARLMKDLDDFEKEVEKEQADNNLKSSDSGWDLYLFGDNPSLLDEEAPFTISDDPRHPDNVFDRIMVRVHDMRDAHYKMKAEVAELRARIEAQVNEEVMHQMAIEMDKEVERNTLKPAESDWKVYLYGANPLLEDEEMPFALTPCDSDLSLSIFGNEAAANVVEAPTKKVAALYNQRNAEITALGIPLSRSDKDIEVRIARRETPMLSVDDEMFFEPGRLPFEYRLAVYEEDGDMSMLLDESLLTDEKPLGLQSSESNMVVKFATIGDTTISDMEMLVDEIAPMLCH